MAIKRLVNWTGYPAGNGDLVVIVDQAGAGTDAVDVSITIGYETVTV